ncbi:MAG: sulfotransferase [Proteobacteria bacterium]|nr:sulfotransferase [Pseudomonadota bacterium]
MKHNDSLLLQARDASDLGDPYRADQLYLQHFRQARTDVPALTEYADFCLQTQRPRGACYLLQRACQLAPADADLRIQLGYAHLALHKFDLAQSQFATAIAIAPNDAQAHHGLGVSLLALKDFAAASAALQIALAGTDDDEALPVLAPLAEACHRAGDHARARALFARAQALAPEHPDLLLGHARFLCDVDEPAHAETLVDRRLRQDADDPRAWIAKARCVRLQGALARAQPWLDRLTQLASLPPEAAEEVGRCRIALGDVAAGHALWIRAIEAWLQAAEHDAAQALIDELLAADPRSAAGWNARARQASARQRFDEAQSAWRQAIACDHALLAPSANLSLHLENANRLDEARRVAETALPHIGAGQPSDSAAGVVLALARVERRDGAPERGLVLLDGEHANGSTDAQRALADIERGKLLDALDRPAEAMAAFVEGNAAAARDWRSAHPEDNQIIAGLDRAIALFHDGWPRRLPSIPALPAHPPLAFLIGFPRSGTTLLNQVLDGHQDIVGMDELPAIPALVEAMRDIPSGYPHGLADLDATDIGWLREVYFDEVRQHVDVRPGQLLLDKFPTGTALAPLLHRVFPQARFVFALRHPCDVVLSCFMQSFQMSQTMLNFCTLADTVALYARTMEVWQMICAQLPLSVHTLRYETLVDNFDAQVQALCAFLRVPWMQELRQYAAKARERTKIRTPSYSQIVRPIYGDARGRWHRYREFLEPHLPALQPYINHFGYSTTVSAASA